MSKLLSLRGAHKLYLNHLCRADFQRKESQWAHLVYRFYMSKLYRHRHTYIHTCLHKYIYVCIHI